MDFRTFTRRAPLGALAMLIITGLLLSACGADATPTTAPAAATPTAAAAGGAAAAPPAPTNTTVVVGSGGTVVLNGAGATFPVPIYTKWFQVYSTQVVKSVNFNYQPL